MKKLIFISFLVVTLQSALYAQTQGLSEEGYKHWVKAVARMENIKQENDYFLVIDEFNKVLETDPNYADTYYNLGKIYTKIGELKNELSHFEKAKECYEKYVVLKPSEKMLIIKELALLELKVEEWNSNNKNTKKKNSNNERYSNFTKFKELELMVTNSGHGLATWLEAKSICAELNIENFNDWYLPSKDELVKIFETGDKDFNDGLVSFWHWSSTEINDKKAYNVGKSGWASDAIKSNKRVDCLCVRKVKQ